MKVLIFLPTYNEKENISQIIEALNQLNFTKEILIIDDNSTDGTQDIIKEIINQYKNLKLIIRKDKKGRGLAGILALKYFIKSKYDIFVEMDADFSHHPKFIPKFLDYIPKYDVVIGSRLVKQGEQPERAKVRRFISIMANFFIRLVLGIRIKDCTSGYRAFKRNILERLNFNKFVSVNPEIVEELLYGCILAKAKIKEIPITFYERAGGKSKLNIKKILYVLVCILKIRMRGKIILN